MAPSALHLLGDVVERHDGFGHSLRGCGPRGKPLSLYFFVKLLLRICVRVLRGVAPLFARLEVHKGPEVSNGNKRPLRQPNPPRTFLLWLAESFSALSFLEYFTLPCNSPSIADMLAGSLAGNSLAYRAQRAEVAVTNMDLSSPAELPPSIQRTCGPNVRDRAISKTSLSRCKLCGSWFPNVL